MIVIYLNKYKETVLDTLNTKKQNLHSIIQQLTYHCTTFDERIRVQKQEATFTKFDTLYTFYLQLDCSIKAEDILTISLNTLRSITPYLLSPNCAKLFGDWQQDCVKMGAPITKETIIKTVSKLEPNS